MDSSFSPKDEIWFLRVCHHISNALYPWDTRLGGPQRRFGRFGEEYLLPLWNSNPGHSLVAIPTQQQSLVIIWRKALTCSHRSLIHISMPPANHDNGHLWVAVSSTSVVAYQRFGETCCLHFQSILMSESAGSSELAVSIHGITSQNALIWTHFHLPIYQYMVAASIFMFIPLYFCVASRRHSWQVLYNTQTNSKLVSFSLSRPSYSTYLQTVSRSVGPILRVFHLTHFHNTEITYLGT